MSRKSFERGLVLVLTVVFAASLAVSATIGQSDPELSNPGTVQDAKPFDVRRQASHKRTDRPIGTAGIKHWER